MKKTIVLAVGLTLAVLISPFKPLGHSEEKPSQQKMTEDKMPADHKVTAPDAPTKEFTVVAVSYEGTKIWLPSTLIVKKGDNVKIKLINNIPTDPSTHGFAIDEFGVKAVVERGKPQTVEFNASKDGLYTIYCQLHPAHIGGQLLVMP